MPEGRKRLIQATKSMLSGKQDKPRLFPAVLGAYVDGIKQIKVQPRPDFVWCRMRGSTSEVIQAFNDSVSLHWDLPVLVFRDPLSPGIWKVYGRDIAQYDDWAGASYLPPHADAHSFGGSSNTGSDPVWVFKRQYMPMLPRPVVSGTLSIFIEADFWYYQGRYFWWPGSGTTSLAPYMPTGALNGVFVTVYMDGPKKIPQFLKGTEFAAWYPPTDPTDFITLPTPAQGPPLAAVFLTTGTTWIGWGEIYDLRSPQQPLGSLTASGSFIAHDEGLLLGSVTHINFTGAGVSASISGSYVTVNVPNVMPGGLVGWDDGVVIGTGTILEAGEGLRMTISGSVLHMDVVGGGPSRAYFLCTSGSTVAPYNRMLTVHHSLPEEYFSASVAVTGTMVKGFITDAGEPAADLLLDGIHHLHVHANRTAGTMDVRLCFQLFRYTAGGAEILLLTSEWSNLLTNAEAEYDIETDAPTIDIDLTDRLLIKVFAQRFSGGSAPDVRIGVHGTTASRYEPPLPGGGGGVVNPPITGSFVIAEEGTVLGSATELNFIGVTVTATLVGPRANITITGGGGGSGTVVLLDDGVLRGSADWLNFRDGLIVGTLSGTYATIDAYIAPLQIDNSQGYFTFTGIYVGDPSAEIIASSNAQWNYLDLIANDQRTLPGSRVGLTASSLLSGDWSVAHFYVRMYTGSMVMMAYPDSLFGGYWFRGFTLGHSSEPRYFLDTGAGTVLAGSGFFVRELPGSPLGDVPNNEGVFFAKASDTHPYYRSPGGPEWDLTVGAAGPAGPPGPFGVMGWDEGIPLGTGTILNVVGKGGQLSLSGTVFELSISGSALYDEGAHQGYFDEVDFVGAGVAATLSGSRATVTVSGGGVVNPPITGSFVIEEEGAVLGSATELNFIGATVTATLVGPRADITIVGGVVNPPITGSLVVDDEGVVKGSATEMDFVGAGVTAAVVAGKATITIPGGGGAGAYPRCAVPVLLAPNYYQVQDYPYLTGSLIVFTNGVAQRPVIDFVEWSAISGIFQYVTSPPTGASHVAYYGK